MCRMQHVMMLGIGLAIAGLFGALIAAQQPGGIPLVIGAMVLFVAGAVMTVVGVLRRQT